MLASFGQFNPASHVLFIEHDTSDKSNQRTDFVSQVSSDGGQRTTTTVSRDQREHKQHTVTSGSHAGYVFGV